MTVPEGLPMTFDVDGSTFHVEGAGGTPGDGPFIVFRMEYADGVVRDISFESNGCPAAHSSALGVIAVARGRTPEQLAALDSRSLSVLIGGLPEGKAYYADLAIAALQSCLRQIANRHDHRQADP
ncbi:MAG: iron-sulfur cluster assembly scaffold protein [Fimbriimonas sp.]